MGGTARPFLVAEDSSMVAKHRALLESAGPVEILWIRQPVQDLDDLRNLGGVHRLWIEATTDDLSPLSSMPDLIQLYFQKGSKIHVPATFAALNRLETLAFATHDALDTGSPTLEWVSGMPRLRGLYLLNTPSVGETPRPIVLDELRHVETLERLELHDYDIADLSPLAELPHLASVRLFHGRVRAAAGLAKTRTGFQLGVYDSALTAVALADLKLIDPLVRLQMRKFSVEP